MVIVEALALSIDSQLEQFSLDRQLVVSLRVQVPNYHILSKTVTYITTMPNSSVVIGSFGPLGFGTP